MRSLFSLVLLCIVGCEVEDCESTGPAPGAVSFGAVPEIYVGGYVDVPLTLGTGAPDVDDIDFAIEGGATPAEGGAVSASPTAGPFGLDRAPLEAVRVLGGARPGTYDLVARDATGAELGRTGFTLTASWTGTDQGPPMWLQGDTSTAYESGVLGNFEGYDGRDLAAQPLPGAREQLGIRRVLMILVDFDDASFLRPVADMKTEWMDALIDGETDPSGRVQSVRDYYEEVSGGRLTIEADIIGPVSVSASMESIMEGAWQEATQAVITAAMSTDADGNGQIDAIEGGPRFGVDMATADTIVFVTPTIDLGPAPMCTPTPDPAEVCDGVDNDCDGRIDGQQSGVGPCATPAACGDGFVDDDEECDDANAVMYDGCTNSCKARREHYPWPQARRGTFAHEDTSDESVNQRYPLFRTPADWLRVDGRSVSGLVAHELGHNLGLPDLYTGSGAWVRSLGNWDLMANGGDELSHLSVSQRLLLGWVDPERMVTFNPFTAEPEPVEVVLSALNTLGAGAVAEDAGVEVRVGDGYNLYLHYRLGEDMAFGDQASPLRTLPGDTQGHLLVTERRSGGRDLMPPQRAVVFGPSDDGSPRIASDSASYGLSLLGGDFTLNVDMVSMDADEAVFDVQYGLSSTDPSIAPWPSETARYQSPDIVVFNDKNRSGRGAEDWKNVPWAGHDNDIVATIRNPGTENARQVQVQFGFKDFNAGGDVDVQVLGVEQVDVPAASEATVTFEGWNPPGTGHYCVVVEILPYTSPDTGKLESHTGNNVAQSNYTRFWSATASPAARVVHDVVVRNPFDRAGLVQVDLRTTSEAFRSFVSSRWVRLEAGEEAVVQVGHEFVGEDAAALAEELQGALPRNLVDLSAWMLDPALAPDSEQADLRLGGVTMEVVPGVATALEEDQPSYEPGSPSATGEATLIRLDTGDPIEDGEVMVTVWSRDGTQTVARVEVGAFGRVPYDVPAPGGVERVELEYLGAAPLAPTRLVVTDR